MKNRGVFLAKIIVCLIMVANFFIISNSDLKAEENEPENLQHDIQEYLHEIEHCTEEGYYTIKNEIDGEVLLKTARRVHVGNEWIDQDNRLFRVVEVNDQTAYARLIKDSVSLRSPEYGIGLLAHHAQGNEEKGNEEKGNEENGESREGREGNVHLAVYHTHGAEAYVPSDGEEFIEEGGGILEVREAFVRGLEEEGATVSYSEKTHVPHDAGAYSRSRRTVEELLKDNPNALIDVHRDAVPEEEYLEEVEGEERVQVMLIVGQQNQNVASNREFAEGLKQATDEEYPGLIRGIFMAQGSYNQEMHPQSVLIEVGAHENRREDAEESAELFAGVVANHVAGIEGEDFAAAREDTILGTGGTIARTILWIVAGTIVAGLAFLAIAAGSWEGFKNKLNHFFNREFADVIGKRRDDGNENDS